MLDILEEAAVAAGKAILDVYHAGPNVSYKADSSPVTDADESAEKKAMRLAETTDVSPNQARELIRKHGKDNPKVEKEAKNFKAEG